VPAIAIAGENIRARRASPRPEALARVLVDSGAPGL
jgi:hypothetical protein